MAFGSKGLPVGVTVLKNRCYKLNNATKQMEDPLELVVRPQESLDRGLQ